MINALRSGGVLLAALAAWAVALLLMAAFGDLGAQVGPHPANAALAPPMPVVTLDNVGSRLGPATDYLDVGERPLLNPDRRPAPVTASTGGDADAPLDAVLTSVLITADLKLAILQDRQGGASRRVRLGEMLADTAWRLTQIEPRRAVFEGPQGRIELPLRVYDGQGGAAPTPQAVAAPAGNAPPATDVAASATPAAGVEASAAPATPEQQVEAIRRRIEARRAMRAAEAQDRPPPPAPPSR